jgi:Icc protein
MKLPNTDRTLEVLQITDTHLYASRSGCLLGVNTDQSLDAAIHSVLAEDRSPDLVLATGDLVHDGSADGYQRIREQFLRLAAPVYCLPGNHDEGTALRNYLQHECVGWREKASWGNWVIIFLDSTIAGSDAGHLLESELQRLDSTLNGAPNSHALVCLHHQPLPIGSRWLDSMAVDNPDSFFSVIDRHAQVRGILWGHVHQRYESQRHNVKLIATPSTCIQFAPGSDEFAVDPIAPGYRWLRLHPDGEIETEVVRLEGIPRGLEVASGGY